jgi:UDP-N-acetylmuramate-alanine ligase
VVVCADEPRALAIAEESGREVLTYGTRAGMYRATTIEYGERTRFMLMESGVPIVALETSLLGEHNIQNIVAAIA